MPLVDVRGITKDYGSVLANNNIDFDIVPGEVHALLGENGSGKTTLMSIMFGLIKSDTGTIKVGETLKKWGGPQDALACGIAMIPQQFRLVPILNAVENIALGLKQRGRYTDQLKTVEERILALSLRYSLKVNPTVPVEFLSMGERQRIEILRALYHESFVILMDEPTSVLIPMEVKNLFKFLVEMVREEGRAIVLTTHKIHEALEIADRVTVLRRGEKVGTVSTKGLLPSTLVEMMIGNRQVGMSAPRAVSKSSRLKDPAIQIRNLIAGRAPSGEPAIRDLSLQVFPGEIVGVAGVEGNGQSELEAVLTGLMEPDSGEVSFASSGTPAYIPSERNKFGVIQGFSIAENLSIRYFARGKVLVPAKVSSPDFRKKLLKLLNDFEIYPPNLDMRIDQMSGGNAQKVVLARELSRNPRTVIAAQPTSGLDIGAASFVRQKITHITERGAASIVISSDLDELLQMCHRIAVMYEGQITGQWSRPFDDIEEIGAAMAGLEVKDSNRGIHA